MSDCPGCGLANYDGLCPVCRGDEAAYRAELEPFFGPWHREPDNSLAQIQEELKNTGALTAVGLHLTQAMSFSKYEALLYMLGTYHSAYQWAIGDALVYGEKVFGHDAYQAAESLRLSPDTMSRYRRVAERIPFERRRPELSWSHHFVVSSLQPGDQIEWLDKAVTNNYSKHELESLLKPPPALGPGLTTCPHCGESF